MPASPDTLRQRFLESLAVSLLAFGVIGGPLAVGATDAWARLCLEALMAGVAVSWALARNRSPVVLLMPVIAAVLIGIQLVPLPDGVLMAIAPISCGAWKTAHAGGPAAWGTISVDPAMTAAAARRMLLGLATITVVADLARQDRHGRKLVLAMAVSFGLLWLAGILFPVGQNDRVLLGFVDLKGPIRFWKTPIDDPVRTSGFGHPDTVVVGDRQYLADGWSVGDGFGPYPCSNHFAGAFCLTLPIAVAGGLAAAHGRVASPLRAMIAAAIWAAALWTVGVMAGSRAGAISLVFAGIVLAAMAADKAAARRCFALLAVGMFIAAALGILAIFTVGLPAGLLETLPQGVRKAVGDIQNDGRALAAAAAWRIFRASPLAGVGLGTFGELQPRFMRDGRALYFAHNDYAQWLAETGLLGLTIGGAMAKLIGTRFLRFLKTPPSANRVIGAGAWAALAGIAAHSAFDWNLHVPANALLASMAAGLALASDAEKHSPALRTRQTASGRVTLATAVYVVICALALVTLARDATIRHTRHVLARAIAAARMPDAKAGDPVLEARLVTAILEGERMAEWDPQNAQLAALLGQANLHLSAGRDGIDSQGAMAAADKWFARASIRAALARGIAEPKR